ncbi:MAG: protein kinase [Bdellovibrionales bacterium]|nr:protein kinase [Bdellovibrionales bacterium]
MGVGFTVSGELLGSMSLIADKYEVVRKLGEGGTGQVYLVKHRDLNVHYALKLLNHSFLHDERFIERFKKEASLLLRFSHPGITQLRDFGRTEEGMYYMAMDYCDGVPLKYQLDSESFFSYEDALQIAIQILDVLEAAHTQGIVHGDIKPENIMLEKMAEDDIRIKVLDFGTAVLKQQFAEEEGAVFGTPCYMSPEQAAGEVTLDQRSDIYSLGVVLYELLTGHVPFEGDTVVQTLLLHLTQPLQSLSNYYGVPREIEEVVFKALEKTPQARYRTARKFREACEKVLHELAPGTAPKAASVAKVQSATVEEEDTDAPEEKRTKILFLDDDEMILNIMQHVFEKEGYEVFTALDCSSIHDYLFEEGIELLVSDVQMPGLPGTKVCRLLKKSMKDLKIILFSNIPERDLEKHSEENMADGWMSKQRKPEDWLLEIRRVLGTS